MTQHVFVDETKAHDYLMVAVALESGELNRHRKLLRSLCMPGQSRIHMRSEGTARRRRIIAELVGIGVQATVYDAGRAGLPLPRRERCLKALVADFGRAGTVRMTFEMDSSILSWDRQRLIEAARSAPADFTYLHARASEEPLLALPDVVAWAWARGGDWRRRVHPIVKGVLEV